MIDWLIDLFVLFDNGSMDWEGFRKVREGKKWVHDEVMSKTNVETLQREHIQFSISTNLLLISFCSGSWVRYLLLVCLWLRHGHEWLILSFLPTESEEKAGSCFFFDETTDSIILLCCVLHRSLSLKTSQSVSQKCILYYGSLWLYSLVVNVLRLLAHSHVLFQKPNDQSQLLLLLSPSSHWRSTVSFIHSATWVHKDLMYVVGITTTHTESVCIDWFIFHAFKSSRFVHISYCPCVPCAGGLTTNKNKLQSWYDS